jgi:hypothetical protein
MANEYAHVLPTWTARYESNDYKELEEPRNGVGRRCFSRFVLYTMALIAGLLALGVISR